jgi:S1-C subfamily serine protease
VLGAELIIESYRTVTHRLVGGGGAGTALVLDRSHLLTNRHVVEAMTDRNIDVDGNGITRPCRVHPHDDMDVAVIEVDLADNERIQTLAGMSFREPQWADEVYLLGYPRVPMTTEDDAITVQRGEVVNPSIETPATGGAPRGKTFLYSAIARPGNSGGPIVAQDGRVIGLVVDHTEEPQSTDLERCDSESAQGQSRRAKPPAPPFYRGVPASQIMQALTDLGFGDLAILEAGS